MVQFCARQFEDVSGQGGGILQGTEAAKSVISAVVAHSTGWDKICGVAPLMPAQGQSILCARDGHVQFRAVGVISPPVTGKLQVFIHLGYTPNAFLMLAD